jgi:hypothetical protein
VPLTTIKSTFFWRTKVGAAELSFFLHLRYKQLTFDSVIFFHSVLINTYMCRKSLDSQSRLHR